MRRGLQGVVSFAGSLGGSDVVTVNGLLTWTEGSMSGSGRTVAKGGLTIAGTSIKNLNGRTLDNASAATLRGTSGIGWNAPGGVFNNLSGAILDVQTDAGFQGSNPAWFSFNNAGVFRKSAGVGTNRMALIFNNAGSVELLAGTVEILLGSYTQTAGTTLLDGGSLAARGNTAAGSTIDLQGGSLEGVGAIVANVNNSAVVRPGTPGSRFGLLSVSGFLRGNYTQTVAGSLQIELGGPIAGTEFDQLSVNGTAKLDGSLTVTLVNGFEPNLGDTFQVLQCSSTSGQFSVVNGLNFAPGKRFQINYAVVGGVTLEVVAAP